MDVSMGDIIKFFTEGNPPKNVEMKFGEAVVEFHSHMEAMRAMLRDKTMLGRLGSCGYHGNHWFQKPENHSFLLRVGYSSGRVTLF